MYSRWEDGCIYSEGSLHAAGHQGTDKLDVKCGWQVCNWHHLSNCPIQPFFTFPTCHPKSSLAREFAQFCSYLPNHRHFVAWGPGRLLSCRVAGNVRHSASGRSLGARGKQQLSFPATHCSVESSPLLNAEGQLASPCPPSQHISHQPSLHLGTRSALCVEEKGFTASSRPPTTSLVFFRAKNTTNWQGPPQKGWGGHPVSSIFPPGASAQGPSSLSHLSKVSRNNRRNFTIHSPIQSGAMVVRCTWHQQQAPAPLCWLQTSEGRDIRATFAPSSEKPEGQKGISYRLQPPYNRQPVSRDLIHNAFTFFLQS